MLTGITGLGGNRKAVENIHNSLVNNWADFLFSCIARLKPARFNIVTDTNSAQWITDLQAVPVWGMIQWPPELAYTSGGQLIAMMGCTDVDFGTSDIEGRVEGSMTWQLKGTPYVNAGTHS